MLKDPKLKTTRGRTHVMSDDEHRAVANELHPDKVVEEWTVGKETRLAMTDEAYEVSAVTASACIRRTCSPAAG